MIDLLTTHSIEAKCRARSREEVVDIAGNLLVRTGAVEPRYIDAMKSPELYKDV
ncbi:hypothetical protein JI721_05150 [Alicyclobacillus cycloheptanicus]|uniref:Mannitol/fructose-specific phosphotransferase system IIA component n=1 Tax=Alicyclobacillus cycloheptanicus TaxID=1457 RepID=A0ABT9XHV1_9BACL|nr:hypothetical protein [Alicyclobacillus cycloheptanicus]MDQ0189892.1 mannitol/fructose-specific phosphotransferase system IIA component [Alicyclobacillus cycloheptanicus]WDM02204.1 hypothetical protein JI721_05150 [Alicyclobacillus cycloheptanicus]